MRLLAAHVLYLCNYISSLKKNEILQQNIKTMCDDNIYLSFGASKKQILVPADLLKYFTTLDLMSRDCKAGGNIIIKVTNISECEAIVENFIEYLSTGAANPPDKKKFVKVTANIISIMGELLYIGNFLECNTLIDYAYCFFDDYIEKTPMKILRAQFRVEKDLFHDEINNIKTGKLFSA